LEYIFEPSERSTVKKQERILRAKLQLQDDGDINDEEADEADDENILWGAKKRAYYDADEQVSGNLPCRN
jgi:hypothetical protein